jgi:long-chain acyl-CoA synthetase
MQRINQNGIYTHAFFDTFFFNEFKKIMGGNIRLLITGSAPTEPSVKDFLKITLCCPVIEVYGMTETTVAGITN